MFSCRKVILSKLFDCKQPQATESLEETVLLPAVLKNVVFLGFQTTR